METKTDTRTKLIVMARTRTDSRDTAGAVHTYYVTGGRSATELARAIDARGQAEIDHLIAGGQIEAEPANQLFGAECSRVGSGFGVTIKYGNGRIRNVLA